MMKSNPCALKPCVRLSGCLLSPGIDPRHPQLAEVQHLLANDLSLFIESFADTPGYLPLALITGSNGKSTVTTMLGHICASCGWDVGIGGNLATPMLDLRARQHDFYVLELSSFQLELGCQQPLRARLATMLKPQHRPFGSSSQSGLIIRLSNAKSSAAASTLWSIKTIAIAGRRTRMQAITSRPPTTPGRSCKSIAGLLAPSLWPSAPSCLLVGKHNRLNALVALAAAKLLDLQPQCAANSFDALLAFAAPLPASGSYQSSAILERFQGYQPGRYSGDFNWPGRDPAPGQNIAHSWRPQQRPAGLL